MKGRYMKNWISVLTFMLVSLCLLGSGKGSILFIAGDPSHGRGVHDYPQSCELLVECLNNAGLGLQEAADSVIYGKLLPIGGDGGVIAVDQQGNVAMPFNTSSMIRGYLKSNGESSILLFRKEVEK